MCGSKRRTPVTGDFSWFARGVVVRLMITHRMVNTVTCVECIHTKYPAAATFAGSCSCG